MPDQTLEPRQLVVELRTRLWVTVRQIQASDHDAVDGCLEVAAVRIVRISGQPTPDLGWIRPAGENRDSIPGTLAVPDSAVACGANRQYREVRIGRLELLKARDVGCTLRQPIQ